MHFNPQTYGRTLVGIYESIVESTPTHPGFLDTTKVLQAFMDPRRFNLLRT